MSLSEYGMSKRTAKERSEAHLRDATYDEIERYSREMGLEVIADEDIMKAADSIIDIGPEGGINGGELTFEGTPIELQMKSESYTSKFLNLYNSSNLQTS